MSELEDIRGIFQRSSGVPLPMGAFPAMIVGRVLPQFTVHPVPNSPLEDPYPPCTDPTTPIELDDCTTQPTPDGNGFYANEFLPCGYHPVRYRWRAEAPLNFDSEMCGYRLVGQDWQLWRQMFYAVNTAHRTQDVLLDYPYVRNGTLVIMSFNKIGFLTNGRPEYGFMFHHPMDPGPARPCPGTGGGGGDPCGCCITINPPSPIQNYNCTTFEDCAIVLGTWIPGIVCPQSVCPPEC